MSQYKMSLLQDERGINQIQGPMIDSPHLASWGFSLHPELKEKHRSYDFDD
jgi:hypothetical protein